MSNITHGVQADHHKFIVPGLIDAEVVKEQSRKQWDSNKETSVIHFHRDGEPCEDHQHEGVGVPDGFMLKLLRPMVNNS